MRKNTAKATTFRIEPLTMSGLEKLSAILKRPLNKLANEAVREYVARRISAVELELTTTLDDLRAYRLSDPDFARSFDKFVDAELAVSAKDDPAEGRVFVEEKRAATAAKVGPAQTALLKVLNG
jgi:hypothetical protein